MVIRSPGMSSIRNAPYGVVSLITPEPSGASRDAATGEITLPQATFRSHKSCSPPRQKTILEWVTMDRGHVHEHSFRRDADRKSGVG